MNTNSTVTIRKRLLIVLLSITFLFCALMGRLGYIQLIAGKSLQPLASEQWYRDLPLKAKRGNILDSNGDVIVGSEDVFTVYARPKAITEKQSTAAALASMLDLDESKLFEKLKLASVSEITVKKSVDFKTGSALRDLNLEGVYFTVDSKRDYTYSQYLAQVVGYTNIDNQGQNGLEGYYDKYLKGTDGFAYTSTDNKGVELEDNVTKYVPSIPGASITATINLNIQAYAESAVKAAKEEWNAKSASVIVMDVNTGGITAMATTPSYDLDDIPRENITLLNAYSKNSMITDVFEPGSTFKIFTAAAALEYGVVSNDSRFYCGGSRIVDGQKIKCWKTAGHGSIDLVQGVQSSCNCVFMDLALKLGTDNLYDMLHKFNFGSKTGVDFFGESAGIMMASASVKPVDLARIGFGQAIAVTPLQLISGVCAVVNGGTYVTPHFVTSVNDSYGNNIFTYSGQGTRVISTTTSENMRYLLENVVSLGSGKKASVAGYRIGGKTGTAQKYSDSGSIASGKYVSSFVGFAPADNPQYAILMLVDEPSGGVYYGSLVAAPYVGRIFKGIFDYKGIKPTVSENVKYVTMPQLDDMELETATKILDELNINYEIAGEGNKVASTLPIVGTEIPERDVVLIRTQ